MYHFVLKSTPFGKSCKSRFSSFAALGFQHKPLIDFFTMKNLRGIHLYLAAYILIPLTASLQAQSLTANLQYYLQINGNANDVSGNGNHATFTDNLVPDRFGVPNSAISFNGSGQTIVLANAPTLKPQLPMSVSLYVWFDALGTTCFSNDFTPGIYTGMWLGTTATGEIHLNYGDGGPTNSSYRRSKTSNLAISAGSWHHIVGVIRDWNDMDIYIDCIDAGGFYSGDGGSLLYDNSPGQLGATSTMSQPGGVIFMSGKVDEIAFWDRALTMVDVEKICNGALNDLFVGVTDQVEADLEIGPNPAHTEITVQIPSGMHVNLLEIMYLHGRVLRSMPITTEMTAVVPVTDFPKGVHMLRLSSDHGVEALRKFVVI